MCGVGALAGSFSLGVLLQILGCVLWHNWWPMLTAFSAPPARLFLNVMKLHPIAVAACIFLPSHRQLLRSCAPALQSVYD